MLHKAVYWQLIVSNPSERVQPPKTKEPIRPHYDEDQTRILVDNLQKLTGNNIKSGNVLENLLIPSKTN